MREERKQNCLCNVSIKQCHCKKGKMVPMGKHCGNYSVSNFAACIKKSCHSLLVGGTIFLHCSEKKIKIDKNGCDCIKNENNCKGRETFVN